MTRTTTSGSATEGRVVSGAGGGLRAPSRVLRSKARRLRNTLVPLLLAAALLSACGEEEPATTAQTREVDGVADSGSVESSAEPVEKENRGANRPERARGNKAREHVGRPNRIGSGRDGDGSGGAKPKRGGAGTPEPESPATKELEAGAQELLDAGEGGRPENDDSGLQVPPALLDQGGRPAPALEDVCLDPDKCPGVREGGG
jgi:hypothetical protein